MTDQITLEEALQLVNYVQDDAGKWHVGIVWGNVRKTVMGNVGGTVLGTISGNKWAYIETPRQKLARLIKEKGDQELIKAFNELEDSDG